MTPEQKRARALKANAASHKAKAAKKAKLAAEVAALETNHMPDKAWVASKPCGCVSVVCAEHWLTQKELLDWGRRGLTARLIPNDKVRALTIRCPTHQRVKQESLFAALKGANDA